MKTELYKNYTWKQYLDNMDNPKTIDFTNEVQLRLRQLIRESRSHNRRTLFEFQEVSNNAYDVLKVQILKYEQTAADGILVYASAILLGDHIPPEKDISATINSVTNNTVTASNATTVQTFSAEYCKEMERPIATTPPVAIDESFHNLPFMPKDNMFSLSNNFIGRLSYNNDMSKMPDLGRLDMSTMHYPQTCNFNLPILPNLSVMQQRINNINNTNLNSITTDLFFVPSMPYGNINHTAVDYRSPDDNHTSELSSTSTIVNVVINHLVASAVHYFFFTSDNNSRIYNLIIASVEHDDRGNGPFVKQDISVVFELSTARAIVDKKIAHFIGNTLFPPEYYELPGSSGNDLFTQLLIAPFPNTSTYKGIVRPDYAAIKGLADVQAWLNAVETLDGYYNFNGDAIVDGVEFFATQNFANKRQGVKKSLLIIASSDIGVSGTQAAVAALKKTSTVITISVGSGAQTLGSLASAGFAFSISNLEDAIETSTVVSNISSKLSSTTTVQETTVCTGPSSIDEDIAVVYDLSSGDVPASPDQVVDFIRSGLFNKSKYGNAQYAAVPFPSISSETDLLTMGYANFALLRSLTHDTLPVWKRHSNLKSTISDGLKNVWRINNGTLGENHRRKGVPNTIMIIAKSDTDVPNSEPIAKVLQAQGSTLLTVSIGAKTNLTPLASNQYSFTVSDFSNSSELASIAEKITEALAPCYAKRR
ncbi:hypothetical protein QR680_000095 [Steinernema hermaphroditum]|uniref:VWFA domain-containing protein n=1 Tax=Steinernema hermaphroditum TaxID=289476 RepID=A0AA39GTD1_9BILA|nr:hypothetical protein QR680_000095 [Steinernema hermaphroditum]